MYSYVTAAAAAAAAASSAAGFKFEIMEATHIQQLTTQTAAHY